MMYSRTFTNGHFHNDHLSTTATATKACPQLPEKPLDNGQFFQRLMKKSRMVNMEFDPYGALIDRGNPILILFHLYCCSKHKLSTILIANVAKLSRFVTLTFGFKI